MIFLFGAVALAVGIALDSASKFFPAQYNVAVALIWVGAVLLAVTVVTYFLTTLLVKSAHKRILRSTRNRRGF